MFWGKSQDKTPHPEDYGVFIWLFDFVSKAVKLR